MIEININNEKRYYDDTYEKKVYKRRKIQEIFCVIIFIINSINVFFYFIGLYNYFIGLYNYNEEINLEGMVFFIPAIFALIEMIILFKYNYDEKNPNNGDNIYLDKYYHETWDKIRFPYFSRESVRIYNDFVSKNRQDEVIDRMYKRTKDGKLIFALINPLLNVRFF